MVGGEGWTGGEEDSLSLQLFLVNPGMWSKKVIMEPGSFPTPSSLYVVPVPHQPGPPKRSLGSGGLGPVVLN